MSEHGVAYDGAMGRGGSGRSHIDVVAARMRELAAITAETTATDQVARELGRQIDAGNPDPIVGRVATQTITPSQTRIRVNHTHTLKDGWRLNETTAEIIYAGFPPIGRLGLDLAAVAQEAFNVGETEAAARNAPAAVAETEATNGK